MTNNDLKDLLYEAQEHLNEAIRLLDNYVRETGDSNAEAYIVDHLRIYAGRGHGFLSDDLNIDDLLERLDESDERDDDDEPGPAIRTSDGRILYWSDTLADYVAIPTD